MARLSHLPKNVFHSRSLNSNYDDIGITESERDLTALKQYLRLLVHSELFAQAENTFTLRIVWASALQ